MKVIACTLDNKTYRYLAYDSASGGYPYWADRLNSAHLYSDSADDQQVLKRELREILTGADLTYSSGEVHPNVMKHTALKLSNKKPSNSGWIVVFELKLEREETMAIEGELKKPTGFIYG